MREKIAEMLRSQSRFWVVGQFEIWVFFWELYTEVTS